jgi:hypothetical protein
VQRELLLLGEIIDAVQQIQHLATDIDVDELAPRRERRDAPASNCATSLR